MAHVSAEFRYKNPKPSFPSGLRAAFAGVGLSLRRGPVRKLYLRLLVVVTLTCMTFQAAGVWAVLHYLPASVDASALASLAHVLAEIVAIILVLLAAPVLAILLVSIALPILAESLFLAALETLRPALASALRASEGLSLAASINGTARRLVGMVLLTFLAFGVSLIPIVGIVIAPAIQLIGTARALSWELLDPWFDLNRIPYAEQKTFVADHMGVLLGFGLPYSFLVAIPILGPMTFGIAQAGAALLVSDALVEPITAT